MARLASCINHPYVLHYDAVQAATDDVLLYAVEGEPQVVALVCGTARLEQLFRIDWCGLDAIGIGEADIVHLDGRGSLYLICSLVCVFTAGK